MMFFFDYIFYRIAQLRFKKDGLSAGTSVAVVSVLQTMYIEIILQTLLTLFIKKKYLEIHSKDLGIVGGLIFTCFWVFNSRNASTRCARCRSVWKHESRKARIVKGLLVLLCFIVPAAIIIIADKITHGKKW